MATGTPSSSTSARLDALPPNARRVAPWFEGLEERLSERRNCEKPATELSTSSIRPDALEAIRALGADGPAAYPWSKEAVIAWTLHASAELIGRGIRVNCTAPGAVRTPMLDEIERTTPSAVIDAIARPFGRRSTSEEQAGPLAFLGSDAAAYVNGAVLPVDGGWLATRSLG